MNKNIIIGIVVLVLLGGLVAYQATQPLSGSEDSKVSASGFSLDPSNDASWSYIVGHITALNLQEGFLSAVPNKDVIDTDEVIKGLREVLEGNEAPFTLEELEEFYIARQSLDQQIFDEYAAENLQESQAFIEEYQEDENVQVAGDYKSFYTVKSSGDESAPIVGEDNVAYVHYTATKMDGTTFEQSSDYSDDPIMLDPSQVIEGMKEALQLMRAGDHWEIVIPAEYAYGETPPQESPLEVNEALIFDVEVFSVEERSDEVEGVDQIDLEDLIEESA